MAADLGRGQLEGTDSLGVGPSVPAALHKDLLGAAQAGVGRIVEQSDRGSSLDSGRLRVEHVVKLPPLHSLYLGLQPAPDDVAMPIFSNSVFCCIIREWPCLCAESEVIRKRADEIWECLSVKAATTV